MEQRDFILREIEKISVMLLGMLGRLKRAQDKRLFEQEREAVSEEFESAVGVDIYSVIEADIKELDNIFSREKGFDFRNMELISDLLLEFSSEMDEPDRRKSIEKSIYLLELVDRESREFSFDRQIRLNELKDLVS